MGISFLEELPDFVPGQLGAGPHKFVGSREITANAAAGTYVHPSAEGKCAPPTTAAAVEKATGGILELLVDRIPNANGLEWASGDLVRYVTEGYIVGLTEEAVSDQDEVFVRITAKGGNTKLGAFRNDPDQTASTFTITIVTTADGAKFEVEESGVVLEFTSGSSQTAAAKATAFAAVIDALAGYSAAAVGAVITVTKASGFVALGETSPAEILTVADTSAATCVKLPRARFIGSASAGAALIALNRS